MTAVTGKNQQFTFGTTTFDGDDCIQEGGLEKSINEVIYQCNGGDVGLGGTKSAVFTVTLALAANDVTKINAVAPGTTGAFTYYPVSTTVNHPKITATRGVVTSRPLSAPVNGVLTTDVTIRLGAITIAAATAPAT